MMKAAIFDNDGTLIDSAGGICLAVNAMLAELGLSSLSRDTVTGFIGKGVLRVLYSRL